MSPLFGKSKKEFEITYSATPSSPQNDPNEQQSPISSLDESETDDSSSKSSASGSASSKPKRKKISVREESKNEPEKERVQEQGTKEAGGWFSAEGELAVDVYQTEREIVIQAPVAGIRVEELDVLIEDDMVTISGERRNPAKEEQSEIEYFTEEVYWGPFSRQIILPEPVDLSSVEAVMKNGIFMLRLPKTEDKIRVKKIKVKG